MRRCFDDTMVRNGRACQCGDRRGAVSTRRSGSRLPDPAHKCNGWPTASGQNGERHAFGRTRLCERRRPRAPHPAARILPGRGDGGDDRPDRDAQSEPQRPHLSRLRHRPEGSPRRRGRHHEGRCGRSPPRRAVGDQGPLRLQAGLAGDFRWRAGAEGQHRPVVLPVRRADREGRRHPRRQDQRPGDGPSRHLRQLPLRRDAQSLRHDAAIPAAPRAAAPRRSPTAFCRSPKGPTPAARSASPRPGAASTATRPPTAASRSSSGRTPSPATFPSSSRARSPAPSRTPRSP